MMLQPNPTLGAQHSFSMVPQAQINRSSFNRSHSVKTTFDAGLLIPFFLDDAIPGDTFNVKPSILARIATLVHPIMDDLFLDVHFFAVPKRLVWPNFVKMMGERDNPADSINFTVPQLVSPVGGYAVGSIFDYVGLPVGVAGVSHSSLPLRAMNLIYRDWYRDQNLIDSPVIRTGDSGDLVADFPVFRRGKRHDYFTSALPFPQKGADVLLPLGTTAPIVFDPASAGVSNPLITDFNHTVLNTSANPVQHLIGTPLDATGRLYIQDATTAIGPINIDPNGSWMADLTSATAVTINALRLAVTVQQLLERDARGGTRYIEIVKSHFGVISPDARLQRPEYLGGGTIRLAVSTVPSSNVAGAVPQANLAAFGVAADDGSSLGFTQSFTEHSVVVGFVSVRAPYTYSQGLERHWSYQTRYDHYFPVFANLGEQPILNKEIYAQGTSIDADTFGYQERWGEMRYKPSKLTGLMRPAVAGSLGKVWTLSQEFGALPLLDQDFIEENPPVDDVIAVPSEPHFIFDSFIQFNAVRPLPVFSVPGLTTL